MRRTYRGSVNVSVSVELDGLDVSSLFGGAPTAVYGELHLSARCSLESDGWNCTSIDPESIEDLKLNDDEHPTLDDRQMTALLDFCADQFGETIAELAACGSSDAIEAAYDAEMDRRYEDRREREAGIYSVY